MSRPRTIGIAVDRAGDVVDELDDELGESVGRRALPAKKKVRGAIVQTRVVAQPIIKHDDAQRIEQLPLVFVDAFDLAVENAGPGRRSARCCLEPIGKPRLGFVLGLAERLTK